MKLRNGGVYISTYDRGEEIPNVENREAARYTTEDLLGDIGKVSLFMGQGEEIPNVEDAEYERKVEEELANEVSNERTAEENR